LRFEMVEKLTVLVFVCLAVVSAAFAERQPFDRYQSILDRQMFGALPPGFDPTKMPSEVSKADQKQLTQEQEKLQSAIRFSVINLTPDGATAVGFTDNSDPKAPVHYYLKVGEKRNGWEVKEADAAAATMTIVKNDVEVSLSLGGNSAGQAGATTRSGGAGSASSAAAPALRNRGLLSGPLGARRRLREQKEQAEKAQAAEAAAQREAERQAQAEADKAQREAERAEQRQQLQAIQEELKRVREEKAAAAKNQEGESDSDAAQE